MPDELKSRTDTKGEASLRGHLKNDGDEKTGSQSYVPPDAKNDKALKMADDLLHGIKVNAICAGHRRQGGDRQARQQGRELNSSTMNQFLRIGRPSGRPFVCRLRSTGSRCRSCRRRCRALVVLSGRLIRGGPWQIRRTI